MSSLNSYLIEQGYAAKGGQIIDATLIPVPKQHNSNTENEQLKQGTIPQDWQDKPHRHAQKDIDAHWTTKGNQNYFGYKDHIGIDAEYGLIRRSRACVWSMDGSPI